MNSDRWEKVDQLFHAALEVAPDLREAFLKDACAAEPDLYQEVSSLLAYDNTQDSFIEKPAIELAVAQLALEPGHQQEIRTSPPNLGDTPKPFPDVEQDAIPSGRTIGNYKIARKIGAGGMGQVYLAEDLKLQRQVALKLLQTPQQFTEQFVQRFHREARAASALNHPNIVTIYSFDEMEQLNFISMEYIEGETLKDRLAKGPLKIAEVLTIGQQIAAAMSAAHSVGIIHRDLKPGNILLTTAGQVKIVDFGLAKMIQESVLAEAQLSHPTRSARLAIDALSQAGSISGTVPYMSPEQTRGMELDARTDLFSLGCVLYEAATGNRPFQGETSRDIIDEILTRHPPAPSQIQAGIPKSFDRMIRKALAKDKDERYQTAAEMQSELKRLFNRQTLKGILKRIAVPLLVIVLAAAILGLFYHQRQAKRDWARKALPDLEALVMEQRFFEAYDLAQEIKTYLPDEARLAELEPDITDIFSVATDPPGATMYLQRYQKDPDTGKFPKRERLGVSPIDSVKIARGDYVMTLEKSGFATYERTLSSAFQRAETGLWERDKLRYARLVESSNGEYSLQMDSLAPLVVDVKLHPSESVPERMVYVPGGPYWFVSLGQPSSKKFDLDGFWIDQFEVTNQEYQEFVAAGGYQDPKYWPTPMIDFVAAKSDPAKEREPVEVPWEEAMSRFTDQTGLPGPSGWKNQTYPPGEENHPVTGVSWYEASAYAAFRGKSLPTVVQWESAARNGKWTVLWGAYMPWGLTGLNENLNNRANVNSPGTVPVGSYPFGMSIHGCHDMCGNATEWCSNPCSEGFATSGGSFNEGQHLFGAIGRFPGFYRDGTHGFRCVRLTEASSNDQGGMAIPDPVSAEDFQPVSEEMFRQILRHYDYDKKPLEAEILEEVEGQDWRRLKIRYVGAKGQQSEKPLPVKERALAYLWLPKTSLPPYQVIVYKPGGASYQGLTAPQETEVVCGPFLKDGRAVYEIVIEGMRERDLPPDWQGPEPDSVAFRQMAVNDTLDQLIGMDYLAERSEQDIDLDRIGVLALSMGGYDLIPMAVDERLKAICLLSAGMGLRRYIPEADPVNFAPYVRPEKLMIHGRYDEGLPLKTSAEPLFHLLSDPKHMIVVDTGHFPPISVWYPPARDFFDRVLGPVKR